MVRLSCFHRWAGSDAAAAAAAGMAESLARGLTQEDVCARMAQLGRPMLQSAYSQIETGRRNLFVSDLIALRTVLNAQYDDFFRGLVPIDRYKDETQT